MVPLPRARGQIKGVIFDLDGTLVDSMPLTFAAFNHGLVAVGRRAMTYEELWQHFGPPERAILDGIVGPELGAPAEAAYQAYFAERLPTVPLFPGTREVIAALHQAGLALGIFTGRGSHATELLLKHHGLKGTFATVIVGEDVEPKPSPEGVVSAARGLGFSAHEVVMVGDSPKDTEAGRRAGSWTFGALWCRYADATKFVGPAAADEVGREPGDLLRFLEQRQAPL